MFIFTLQFFNKKVTFQCVLKHFQVKKLLTVSNESVDQNVDNRFFKGRETYWYSFHLFLMFWKNVKTNKIENKFDKTSALSNLFKLNKVTIYQSSAQGILVPNAKPPFSFLMEDILRLIRFQIKASYISITLFNLSSMQH